MDHWQEKIASIEKTMEYFESAWKNIYSDYADRKISKDEYFLLLYEWRRHLRNVLKIYEMAHIIVMSDGE